MKRFMIAAAAAAPLLVFTPAVADEQPGPPSLTVRGEATIMRPADELRLSLGVVSRERTAEQALADNNSKMNKVIASLKGTGLEEGEYKTGRFSIRPIYSQRPKNAAPDWSPDIVGYEVSNSLAITTGKIKLAGDLIDEATGSGANSVDSISFGLKDPREFRHLAIEAAAKNAFTDAKTLGSAAGVTLGKVRSLSLDGAQSEPIPRSQYLAKSMYAESVPIEAGEVEIRASVTAVFAIE